MERTNRTLWPGWETTRMIGRGGFGTVYEIERKLFADDEEPEKAALKVIRIPQNNSDIEDLYNDGYDQETIAHTFEMHLESIADEYKKMRKMDGSANVVNCKDIRCIRHSDGIGWDILIRMELLTPLMKALPVDNTEATAIKIGRDICNALVLCKKNNIIHRDIKPQNIFVSANGDYKLGDFGIAKTVEKTMGATKIGTYKYMAPEVYHDQPYGSSADIYSLGLVLYWLLNERRMPFMPPPSVKLKAGQDEEAKYRRLSGEKLPAPAHGSKELKRIVLKACAFDPKDRYPSAAAMLEDLSKLTGHIPPAAVSAQKRAKTQGDDTTADPAFDGAKTEVAGYDTTVCLPPVEKTQPVKKSQKNGKKKISVQKYVLIALGIVIAAVLVLLLRSCGGDKPMGNPFRETTEAAVTEDSGGFLEQSNELQWEELPPRETTEAVATEDSGTVPEQPDWSDWMEELPEYVNETDYEIKEDIFYSSQTMEIAATTETDAMAGWELFNVAESAGWDETGSNWSDIPVESTPTRKVETQMRYRYQDKETTTGSTSGKDGWTLYDTTYAWGGYGPFSEWSETPVTASDSRKVESKLQYQYKDIWTTQEPAGWGEPGEWTFDRQETSELLKEESRTVYGYYYFQCPDCGDHMHGWGQCWTWANGCGATTTDSHWHEVWSEIPWDQAGLQDWHGTGKYSAVINNELVFKWPEGGVGTQYRYIPRTFQTVTHESNWSEWSDTVYTASDTREVRSKTLYRYQDRSQIATYHFYRWGTLSEWTPNPISATNNRKVEQKLFYKYYDQVTEKTYYFRRPATDWSAYTDEEVTPSDTVNVRTKKVYAFKSKSE